MLVLGHMNDHLAEGTRKSVVYLANELVGREHDVVIATRTEKRDRRPDVLDDRVRVQVYRFGQAVCWRRVTVNEMVDMLDQVMDRDVTAEHVEQPEGDVSHTHADIRKARDVLGYEPETSFEPGVRSCVDWCREIRDQGLL